MAAVSTGQAPSERLNDGKQAYSRTAVARPHSRAKFVARAGVRVSARSRDLSNANLQGRLKAAGDVRAGNNACTQHEELDIGVTRAASSSRTRKGLLGTGDEEDVQFLGALKGLIDSAVKQLGTEKGFGARIFSGLLRKTGVVDSFIDSMVTFVDDRLGVLMEALRPKDAACALAVRLRRHVQAHDAMTADLGIRAGRRKCTRATGHDVSHGVEPTQDREHDLEEDELTIVIVLRGWKRCGGFWPPSFPNPDDSGFDGPKGLKEFMLQLDEGTQTYLKYVSGDLLDAVLPEDIDELRAAGANASDAGGQGVGRAGDESSRAVLDTARRLAQLKSSVLEPMLCQVLTQQVIGRFCRAGKLWQFLLRIFRPNADTSSTGHDLKHPEVFSLMARALSRLRVAPTGVLKMELMQGLVKMAWDNRKGPATPLSGVDVAQDHARAHGSRLQGQEPPAYVTDEACRPLQRPRSDSGDSSLWSEVDFASETTRGDEAIVCPRSHPLPSTEAGSNSGGAKAIFNMPYAAQLSHGLAGGEKDKFYEDLEELALQELAEYLRCEIVEKVPLSKIMLPESWVADRVEAARAFARRPTNLMLVLSALDAAKDILRAAADKVKAGKVKAGATGALSEGMVADYGIGPAENVQKVQGTSDRRRAAIKTQRDTPGRQVWETRREYWFGSDMGAAALHVSRCILGEAALDIGDIVMKTATLEHSSVRISVRHEMMKALRGWAQSAAPELLLKIKPAATQPILYVSSQMRMLRALKRTGLDFSKETIARRDKKFKSALPPPAREEDEVVDYEPEEDGDEKGDKSFGNGPQKRALSRRFKSYSWIFTDALISKLVALKMGETTRNTLSNAVAVPRGEGQDSNNIAEGSKSRTRCAGPQRTKAQFKRDVMREIMSFSKSKDLLSKVLNSWLPAVMAAHEEGILS